MESVLENPLHDCKLLNVNIPACAPDEIQGFRVCRQGNGTWVEEFQEGKGTWDLTPYYEIAQAFYSCGEKLSIPITWGCEWRVKDCVHFEIKK